LRGAIAGLYADHARRFNFTQYTREAEYAFSQSLQLYPLSPEANFRYAELQVKQGKFEQARLTMQAFKEQDPGNDKIDSFLSQLDNMESGFGRMRQLEQEITQSPGGRLDVQKALQLAVIYKDMKEQSKFMSLTDTILNNTNLPHQVFMNLAQLYAQVGDFPKMARALEIYLTKVPTDVNAIIDLAALRVMAQQPNAAIPLLERAAKIGGPSISQRIMQDRRFTSLRALPEFQKALGASASPAPGFGIQQPVQGGLPGTAIPFPNSLSGPTPPTTLPAAPPPAAPPQ
jgi:thioredoxin-like negative regulator of GroEL